MVKSGNALLGSAYKVYDNKGIVVLNGIIHSQNTKIELGHLPQGIYSVSIGEISWQTDKVIRM